MVWPGTGTPAFGWLLLAPGGCEGGGVRQGDGMGMDEVGNYQPPGAICMPRIALGMLRHMPMHALGMLRYMSMHAHA